MDERLEPGTQIGSDRRKPPALHSKEDVAIAALAHAPDCRSDQCGPESLPSMLRRHKQIAQLSPARKIEARSCRVMDGANGPHPGGRRALLHNKHAVRYNRVTEPTPRTIAERSVHFYYGSGFVDLFTRNCQKVIGS